MSSQPVVRAHGVPTMASQSKANGLPRVLGVRREDKNKWERRAPVAPRHVRALVQQGIKVIVQPSTRRVFSDDEYREAGAVVQEDLTESGTILAVKEVPIELLLPGRTWCFFSHTIKGQKANMPLLDAVLEKKVRLVDYECITKTGKRGGSRLVAFGAFAGNAGAIDFLRGIGERFLALGFSTPLLHVGSAFMYPSLAEAQWAVTVAGNGICEKGLPAEFSPFVVVFTGNGNVTRGALDIFKLLPHQMVEPGDLPALIEAGRSRNVECRKLFLCVATSEHMVRHRGGLPFDKSNYYAEPHQYESIFQDTILPYTSVVVNCMYWDERFPRLFTNADLHNLAVSGQDRLLGVCDITCDADGSVPTRQFTSIEHPFFILNALTDSTTTSLDEPGVLFHAVDHLPSELPREASEHFGDCLLPFLPEIVSTLAPEGPDQHAAAWSPPMQGAIVAAGGRLTRDYEYIDQLRNMDNRIGVSDLSAGLQPTLRPHGSQFAAAAMTKVAHDRKKVDPISANSTDTGVVVREAGVVKPDVENVRIGGSQQRGIDRPQRSVLVLGAGFVSAPLVEFLLRSPENTLTVASIVRSEVEAFAQRFGPRVRPVVVDITSADSDESAAREALVKACDAIVSLVPATLHVGIARLAIKHCKPMVTASYVSEEMQALDAEARAAGVLIINEVGLDPGIDHMSAMKMIDEAKGKVGNRILSFSSLCGGLPAPEAAGTNPLGYKFSWSPKGVLLAARNAARYRKDGKLHEVPASGLLAQAEPLTLNNSLAFEVLPNRDSTVFAKLYGLEDAPTFFRGTLRYNGFCERMLAIACLGLLEPGPLPRLGSAKSRRQWLAQLLDTSDTEPALHSALNARLGGSGSSDAGLEFLTWLGLLGDELLPTSAPADSPIDVITQLLQRDEMAYQQGERDMVAMHHELKVACQDGQVECRTATLIDYGLLGGATAMSRTVGLTAAICVQLVLDDPGKFGAGVQRPLRPEWYEPVLRQLEFEGIRLQERVEVLKASKRSRSPGASSVGMAGGRSDGSLPVAAASSKL